MAPPAPLLPDARPTWRERLFSLQSGVIALACALLVTALWWDTRARIAREHAQAIAAAEQAIVNLALAYEQQIERVLRAAEQVAVLTREHYREHETPDFLATWAERGVIREEMFRIVSVVNAAGNIVASTQETAHVNYSDRPFFRAQRDSTQDRLFVNPPVLGRASGRWQVPMSVRITRADGGFDGVVVLSVDPEELTRFWQEVPTQAHGLFELTGLDGVVRSRIINGTATFGAPAEHLPWFMRHAQAGSGVFIDDGKTLDGIARIVSYRGIGDYPLMVAVGSSLEHALRDARQRRATYLAVASATTAALVLLAAALMQVLARQRAALRALRASEARFRATFGQAASGMVHIAPGGAILAVNDKFCGMLGYTGDELRRLSIFDLCDNGARDRQYQRVAAHLAATGKAPDTQMEVCYRRKDGTPLWVSEALAVVRDGGGRPSFIVAVAHDISERVALQARLSHAASHDALTGLPNRALLMQRLQRALSDAREANAQVGVLCLDLDGFKEVNDRWGHAIGDLLLQEAAERLRQCLRGHDTVARFGGDEFSLLLPAVSGPRDCEIVAHKAVQALAAPFTLQGTAVQISASVGIALFPRDGPDAGALLVRADHAMYRAKRLGKNRHGWAV